MDAVSALRLRLGHLYKVIVLLDYVLELLGKELNKWGRNDWVHFDVVLDHARVVFQNYVTANQLLTIELAFVGKKLERNLLRVSGLKVK